METECAARRWWPRRPASAARSTSPARSASPANECRARVARLCLAFGVALAMSPGEFLSGRIVVAQGTAAQNTGAQGNLQPSGLQAALALQQVVVDSIGRAERSVVAIARERRSGGDGARREPPMADDGVRAAALTDKAPDDPDYVPHEFGTGVVIDRAGLIVTNYHVLGDPKQNRYWVWVQKRPYLAEVKAADPWLDLAVLKISAENLEPVVFGDAKDVRRGQIVLSLGNPYAIARDGQPSATWGIVSNLSRRAPADSALRGKPSGRGDTLHQYGTLIQTDCKLQLGTSGGALVNLKGELIGLTTALAAMEGSDAAAGFAIPVDETFKRVLDVMKAGRKPEYGFLGVAPELLSVAERQQGRVGVRVQQIVPGTPAARSGLRETDLITQVAGAAVGDVADLIREVSRWPAESTVELLVARDDGKGSRPKTVRVPVELSKKHLGGPLPPFGQAPDRLWRGAKIDHATASPLFSERLRDVDPDGCVAVIDVEPDSPAWVAGLRPGMFVSHVEQQRVTWPREFWQRVAESAGPVRVRVTGIYDKEAVKVVAPP